MRNLLTVFSFLLLFPFGSLMAQYSVSGHIRCANNQVMNDVAVTISGDGINQTVYTDANGYYEFENLGFGTYNVTPHKAENNPAYGVTTFDIVVAIQSIFNPGPVSPFAILAADFNNSGSVTTLDLLEIRKILLGITTECPNDQCWRFASTDFQVSPPGGSVDFITVENLEGEVTNIDFVGVKLGDVNFSACP